MLAIDENVVDNKAMPIRKRDTRLIRRHFVATTIVGVPLLACLGVAWWRPAYFWSSFVVGSILAIFGLVIQELRFRRYRCPDCGSQLPYPSLQPGARIEYHCSRCDIIWDSGFVEPKPGE